MLSNDDDDGGDIDITRNGIGDVVLKKIIIVIPNTLDNTFTSSVDDG